MVNDLSRNKAAGKDTSPNLFEEGTLILPYLVALEQRSLHEKQIPLIHLNRLI